jgi:hypothetical protein
MPSWNTLYCLRHNENYGANVSTRIKLILVASTVDERYYIPVVDEEDTKIKQVARRRHGTKQVNVREL